MKERPELKTASRSILKNQNLTTISKKKQLSSVEETKAVVTDSVIELNK